MGSRLWLEENLLEAQILLDQDDGDATGEMLPVDDQELVDGAALAVHLTRARILQGKSIFLDSTKTLIQGTHENRRILYFAGSVRDRGRNRQKWTQKVSILTDIVAKHLKRKHLLQTGVRAQTGLHFEAFYVSWICPTKKYFLKQVRQDLCQKVDSAVKNYVQLQWLYPFSLAGSQ